MMQRRHPVETLDLIVPHLSALDDCALAIASLGCSGKRTRRGLLKDQRLVLRLFLLQQLLIFFLLRLAVSVVPVVSSLPQSRAGPDVHGLFALLGILRGNLLIQHLRELGLSLPLSLALPYASPLGSP